MVLINCKAAIVFIKHGYKRRRYLQFIFKNIPFFIFLLAFHLQPFSNLLNASSIEMKIDSTVPFCTFSSISSNDMQSSNKIHQKLFLQGETYVMENRVFPQSLRLTFLHMFLYYTLHGNGMK